MSNDPPLRDLLPVLASLAEWFSAQRISYAIIGGAAISLVAQPRLTEDIDVVVWVDLDEAESLLKSGARFGFLPRISAPVEFARRSRVLLLRDTATKIDIDISLGALPFEREMIERALHFSTAQLKLRVASPEDLIVTKAVAHRKIDLIDIDHLLAAYRNLDLERIRFWVKEFAKVLEMPELLADFDNLLKKRD